MTGVTNTYNPKTGAFGTTPYTVNLPFQTYTDTEVGKRYLGCDLNLIGVIGNEQIVNLTVEFEAGPDLVAEPLNYHDRLAEADFNNLAEYTLIGAVDMAMIASGNVTIEPYADGGTEDIDVSESTYTYAPFDRYPNVAISDDAQGVVIWTHPDGKHGLVLGGLEESDVTWGETARIDGTSNPISYGPWNFQTLELYFIGRPNVDMGATKWVLDTYPVKNNNGSISWFIPSRGEYDLLMEVMAANPGAVESALTQYGFGPLTGNYWTSETKPYVWPGEDPIAEPEEPAKIYVWDGTDVYLESDARDTTVPSRPVPITNKVRAFRFF
jgi:hypothetical protein